MLVCFLLVSENLLRFGLMEILRSIDVFILMNFVSGHCTKAFVQDLVVLQRTHLNM